MAYNDSSKRRLHPSPRNDFVLFMQYTHRSKMAWMDDMNYKSLNIRCMQLAGLDVIPESIVSYLCRADFLGDARMVRMEVTVTLEDVARITGLPTDGESVTGMSETRQLRDMVLQLLGRTSSASDMHGGCLKTSWLDQNFANVEHWMQDEENLLRFTRAYILRLSGGFLLADHSGGRVHLRYLPFLSDLDACGRFSLRSAWARFVTITPKTIPTIPEFDDSTPVGVRWTGHKTIFHDLSWYRERFDKMTEHQVVKIIQGLLPVQGAKTDRLQRVHYMLQTHQPHDQI
ncbi:serine/threonine-protein phosphatase 7 long form homolog [Gastrolobium bilobum]|uniref:serine/threonine-protein phosphatase 7 long form homolog n=1 Tax=Gastrolobium bilobum TaxID=150636 RepID=UPI002AB074F2|nr:serine/threonine-protein phosphatase 7 long form homolog [Gastrolobium bilobum]